MNEREHDNLLGIKTVGKREWRNQAVQYSRYEATPYEALDRLFEMYTIKQTDKVVDFGCGRGRVAFYIHNRFKVPVTGIEVHDITYDEALDNKMRYEKRTGNVDVPIKLEYGLAEHYEIDPKDNIFYFFNPFSVDIFKKVVANILDSVERHERCVDIIFYYPLPKFKKFLREETPFKLINKVRIPGTNDKNDKFVIYRLT